MATALWLLVRLVLPPQWIIKRVQTVKKMDGWRLWIPAESLLLYHHSYSGFTRREQPRNKGRVCNNSKNLVVTFSIIARGVKHIQCARFYNTVVWLNSPPRHISLHRRSYQSRTAGGSPKTPHSEHVPRLPPPVALNQTLNLVKRFSPVAGRSSARQTQEDGWLANAIFSAANGNMHKSAFFFFFFF